MTAQFIGFNPWEDVDRPTPESIPVLAIPEQFSWDPEPDPPRNSSSNEIVGIQKIIQEGEYKEFLLGTAIDYNGVEYDFEWDRKTNRLARLKGREVTELTWSLVTKAIEAIISRPPTKPAEKPTPIPETVAPLVEEFSLGQPPATYADIYSQVEMDIKENGEEEKDLSDDDISTNALKVLQEI